VFEALDVPGRCETAGIQAFLKMAAKAWIQFRFQLRRDFIKKGLQPFTRHPFIVPE
jgi:hypothetical protein